MWDYRDKTCKSARWHRDGKSLKVAASSQLNGHLPWVGCCTRLWIHKRNNNMDVG